MRPLQDLLNDCACHGHTHIENAGPHSGLSRIECQIPNDLTRVRKLMSSSESSDTNLLASIAKVETDEELKSYFEAAAACVLLCDPVASNKSYSIKNEKQNVPDASIAPMKRSRD